VGLKINKLKTKEMRVNRSTDLVLVLTNGSATEQVEPFIHLGGIVSQLHQVWKNDNISVRTKIRLFKYEGQTVLFKDPVRTAE
jgi:hypothetical protein